MTCDLRSSEIVIVQNSHLLIRSSFQEICDFPPLVMIGLLSLKSFPVFFNA